MPQAPVYGRTSAGASPSGKAPVFGTGIRRFESCRPSQHSRRPPLTVRLSFFKLNVPDMEAALGFWQHAFGFQVVQTFDEPEFLEHIMALPGQEAGPNLLLVSYKDGRGVTPSPGHGPVGFQVDDIEAAHRGAVAAGAEQVTGVFAVDGISIALLRSPQGHEIELVQLP